MTLAQFYQGTVKPLFVGAGSFAGRRECQNELLRELFFGSHDGEQGIPLAQRIDNARIEAETRVGDEFDVGYHAVDFTKEEVDSLRSRGLHWDEDPELRATLRQRWVERVITPYDLLRSAERRSIVQDKIDRRRKGNSRMITNRELRNYFRQKEEENPSLRYATRELRGYLGEETLPHDTLPVYRVDSIGRDFMSNALTYLASRLTRREFFAFRTQKEKPYHVWMAEQR